MPIWIQIVLGVWLIPAALIFVWLLPQAFRGDFRINWGGKQIYSLAGRILVLLVLSLFWPILKVNS